MPFIDQVLSHLALLGSLRVMSLRNHLRGVSAAQIASGPWFYCACGFKTQNKGGMRSYQLNKHPKLAWGQQVSILDAFSPGGPRGAASASSAPVCVPATGSFQAAPTRLVGDDVALDRAWLLASAAAKAKGKAMSDGRTSNRGSASVCTQLGAGRSDE